MSHSVDIHSSLYMKRRNHINIVGCSYDCVHVDVQLYLSIMYINIYIQVAALAPLALLLVPEVRCDHLVFTHLKYD